jgi:peroxiredoxin
MSPNASTRSSKNARIRPRLLPIAAALGTLLAGSASANPDIAREGVGDRRAALDKIELTPFDQGLWAGLADWKNGSPVTPESTQGKVVVIYTFAGYLPTAVRPISIVNRLAERYGEEGLVVVGVHTDEAYEDGVKTAERRRVSFPIARDAGNAIRAALKVDQDPDFYIIDRSGRLRYADVETASVEKAVSELIAESTDDAETLLDRRAADAAKADEAARRSARLRSQVDLANLPWIPFAPPSPDAYKNADWPEMDTGDDNNRRRSRGTQPSGPIRVDLAIDQDWRPGPPQNTEGRAVLVYLFTDKAFEDLNRFGYSPAEFFGEMNRLQREHSRDLIVIGAMQPSEVNNNRRRRTNDDSDAQKRAEKAAEVFDTLNRELPVNHPRINDIGGSFLAGKYTPNNGDLPGRSGQIDGFLYPYHFLISSDGVVRWHGSTVTSPERRAEYEAAFRKLLEVDPGVQARRQAEQAYIKSLTE